MKKRIGGCLALAMTTALSVFASTPRSRSLNQARFQPKAATSSGEVLITSYGQKPVYGRLPRKEFYRKRYDERKKRHAERGWELRKQGIHWTPFGLYHMHAI